MSKHKLTPEEKIELAKKIYNDFSFTFNHENQSYYFLKLENNKKSKEFRSMEEGLESLRIWLQNGIINDKEKLDLMNLLVRAPLPHVIVLDDSTRRKTIFLRWSKVTTALDDVLDKTKQKIKPKYKPKLGEL